MPSRFCPSHGEVPGHLAGCPHEGCSLPLLRLEGGGDQPAVLEWENRDGVPEVDGARDE